MAKIRLKPGTEKVRLQRAMAEAVGAAGYTSMAREIRNGNNVEGNVNYFLRLYKKKCYGKFHAIRADGSVDKIGKIDSNQRAHYDRVEKYMKMALRLWKQW